MSNNNNRNFSDQDRTGEIISWVIIFILLASFFPVGLFFLFMKLRGSSKNSQSKSKQNNISSSDTAKTQKPPQQQTSSQSNPQQHKQEASRYTNAVPVKYKAVSEKPNKSAASTTTSNDGVKAATSFTQEQPKTKKIRNPLKKKTGKSISVMMFLISLTLFILAFFTTGSVLQEYFVESSINWFGLTAGSFYFLGGLTTFLSRNVVSRRYSRYKNYFAHIGDRGVVPLSELAQVAGVSVKAAIRDLHVMINNGYLIDGSYIDNDLDCLVLSPVEAQKIRMNTASKDDIIKSARTDSYNAQDNNMTQSSAADELRNLNLLISDATICAKVSHLVNVTDIIFKHVEEFPEKNDQLKRFRNYYLPTTIKLVRSYATLEKQGIKGENIISAKNDIGNILDTLKTGFEQQLDVLFKSDAIDIASDITVLENLMQQDGLMNSGSAFQVMPK